MITYQPMEYLYYDNHVDLYWLIEVGSNFAWDRICTLECIM